MTTIQIMILQDRVPEELIAILASHPDMNGQSLILQDYRVRGELVIPLFSSEVSLQESIQSADLGCAVVAISRGLLASILHGSEVFLLDPGLQSELRFTAGEFRQAFPQTDAELH